MPDWGYIVILVNILFQVVQVAFSDFRTEETYDYVTLSNGFNQSAAEIATLSGSPAQPLEYSSDQNYMFVKFVSDQSGIDRGFTSTFISTGRKPYNSHRNCVNSR